MSKKEILYRRLLVLNFWLLALLLTFAAISFVTFINRGTSFVFVFVALVLCSLTYLIGRNLRSIIANIDYERQEEINKEIEEKEQLRQENKRVYGKEYVPSYEWPMANVGWEVKEETEQ